MNKQLFWLHIKKSAGLSTRSLLHPYYKEVDRTNKPKNFIQAQPDEYNDILNNFRVPLGELQFKRCLFAKTYLYPEQWDDIFSFAFSREPVDRAISMFYYLFWKDINLKQKLKQSFKWYIKTNKLLFNTSYAFDLFLDYADEARHSDSIYQPIDNHFTTHTAPMWDDITDLEGNVLLRQVFRLENLIEGINLAFEESGIDKKIEPNERHLNKNKDRKQFTPSKSQLLKIEKIYSKDFDIYENAFHK